MTQMTENQYQVKLQEIREYEQEKAHPSKLSYDWHVLWITFSDIEPSCDEEDYEAACDACEGEHIVGVWFHKDDDEEDIIASEGIDKLSDRLEWCVEDYNVVKAVHVGKGLLARRVEL